MITKINFIFLFTILCFYTKSLIAVPAFPGHIIFKQKDGSTFIGKQFGDEWFNWIEAEDGNIVLRDRETHEFRYAEIVSSRGVRELQPSNMKFSINKTQRESNRILKKSKDIPVVKKSDLYEMWTEAKIKAKNIKNN